MQASLVVALVVVVVLVSVVVAVEAVVVILVVEVNWVRMVYMSVWSRPNHISCGKQRRWWRQLPVVASAV